VSKVKAARDKLKAELDDKSADIERLMKDVARHVLAHANAEKELDEAKQNIMKSSRLSEEKSTLLKALQGELVQREKELDDARNNIIESCRLSVEKTSLINDLQGELAQRSAETEAISERQRKELLEARARVVAAEQATIGRVLEITDMRNKQEKLEESLRVRERQRSEFGSKMKALQSIRENSAERAKSVESLKVPQEQKIQEPSGESSANSSFESKMTQLRKQLQDMQRCNILGVKYGQRGQTAMK